MKTVLAYKLAKPDGFDFFTGKTINYRENIGKIVRCPNPNPRLGICSDGVLHASENPNDCFVGANIPCSAYRVQGKSQCGDKRKWGFTELEVLEEILDLDTLFGWEYSAFVNPYNPLSKKGKPTISDIALLKEWASVRESVRESVWASIKASVGDNAWDSLWDSLWESVKASVGNSVWESVKNSLKASIGDSVWASVGDSVWESVWAYVGSLSPMLRSGNI